MRRVRKVRRTHRRHRRPSLRPVSIHANKTGRRTASTLIAPPAQHVLACFTHTTHRLFHPIRNRLDRRRPRCRSGAPLRLARAQMCKSRHVGAGATSWGRPSARGPLCRSHSARPRNRSRASGTSTQPTSARRHTYVSMTRSTRFLSQVSRMLSTLGVSRYRLRHRHRRHQETSHRRPCRPPRHPCHHLRHRHRRHCHQKHRIHRRHRRHHPHLLRRRHWVGFVTVCATQTRSVSSSTRAACSGGLMPAPSSRRTLVSKLHTTSPRVATSS